MIFFQGTWYCAQCGMSSDMHVSKCNQCEGDEFQTEPYAPTDDLDQLNDRDKERLLHYDVGNF